VKQCVVVTLAADRDLDEQFLFIARDSREAAARLYAAAQATFEELAATPELGAIWQFSDVSPTEIRVWQIRGFKNHLVFYRRIEGGVEIVRVLHGARDIAAIIENESP
jgi:toxin ParE1/3/4